MGESDDDDEVCERVCKSQYLNIAGVLIDVVAYDVIGREDGRLWNGKRAQSEYKTCACSWT